MGATTVRGHAVVVYESMFGNTRRAAEAIGAGLRAHFEVVEVLGAAAAPTSLDGVDLLVVGAPTHAFGMPRRSTRVAASEQGGEEVPPSGVREWLAALDRPVHPIAAMAFDTRARSRITGSARRPINRRLRRLGFRTTTPVSFTVTATPGPLADGELEAARRWADAIEPEMAEAWAR
jgi:hypothetical protein